MNTDVLKGIGDFLLSAWEYPGVKLIVAGVVLNVVLAVAAALRTGSFSFQLLADFLVKQLAPYVLVYFGFSLLGDAAGFAWVSTAVLALITASIAARIVANLADLGVPIPERVVRVVNKPQKTVTLRKINVNES